MAMMQEEGEQIGRFKVRSLMRELALISKQPGSHTYKKATVERPDIPNTLNRAFDVEAPNQVWCGDITYVWAQGKWHYLAVVLDLYARRVVGWALSEKPDADLVVKALDVAYEQRGKPQGLDSRGLRRPPQSKKCPSSALSHPAETTKPLKTLTFSGALCTSRMAER